MNFLAHALNTLTTLAIVLSLHFYSLIQQHIIADTTEASSMKENITEEKIWDR
jgi:hypothetical protein